MDVQSKISISWPGYLVFVRHRSEQFTIPSFTVLSRLRWCYIDAICKANFERAVDWKDTILLAGMTQAPHKCVPSVNVPLLPPKMPRKVRKGNSQCLAKLRKGSSHSNAKVRKGNSQCLAKLRKGNSHSNAKVRKGNHTCHILPPFEIDLGLCLAVFAGSGGKCLFHRIGWKGRIWQLRKFTIAIIINSYYY